MILPGQCYIKDINQHCCINVIYLHLWKMLDSNNVKMLDSNNVVENLDSNT